MHWFLKIYITIKQGDYMADLRVQVSAEFVREDGDGYFIFSTPFAAYVQTDEGKPTGKAGKEKKYITVKINEEGKVKTSLT